MTWRATLKALPLGQAGLGAERLEQRVRVQLAQLANPPLQCEDGVARRTPGNHPKHS